MAEEEQQQRWGKKAPSVSQNARNVVGISSLLSLRCQETFGKWRKGNKAWHQRENPRRAEDSRWSSSSSSSSLAQIFYAATAVAQASSRPTFSLTQNSKCLRILAFSHPYLDVFAEEVGIETQPVPGNVEAALQKDVSEESTGVH